MTRLEAASQKVSPRTPPIDRDFQLVLREHPPAQRLYKILHRAFWAHQQAPRITFRYPVLCRLLKIRPRRRPATAMKALERAHEALQSGARIRVLDHVRWTWDGGEARVHYYVDRGYFSTE